MMILEKQRGLQPTFNFQFEVNADVKNGHPYVAQLHWNSEKNIIGRTFFESTRQHYKGMVTVFCKYQAKVGDVIEQRQGGSLTNDNRAWFLVKESGEMEQVADIDSSSQKIIVRKYLRGKITAEEMLNQLNS